MQRLSRVHWRSIVGAAAAAACLTAVLAIALPALADAADGRSRR